MQELDPLIEKFWTGRTTEAENRLLLQLLQQREEEHRQKMQDEFGRVDLSPDQAIGEERARQLLEQIHARFSIGQPAAPRISWLRRSWKGVAVAACLLIGSGVFLLRDKQPLPINAAAPVAAVPAAHLVRFSNSSDTVMTIGLKDGSVIQLQKNSGISYYEPFIDNRRDISLSGVALFKVAKDKDRPFSVYAGGTITRVLGTRFLVNAGTGAKVTVRLLEGSIAVETRPAADAGSKAILLKTGQEIAVNKVDHSYAVSTVIPAGNNRANASRRNDNPGLAFNKEPLKQVFRKMGESYGVTISYDPTEMDGLYFTGTFLKTDELISVLSTICNVNDLTFKQEGDIITISKLH